MQISFPTDSDGFLSQECPSCGERFKVLFGQGSEEPISCCPYCRHRGQDCWYTTKQVEYMRSAAARLIAPDLERFQRQMSSASSRLIKITTKLSLPGAAAPPMETDDPFEILYFPCCAETIKADRRDKLFCVTCAMEINMTLNESKYIFLSHKGVDKALVLDFKHALDALGYATWLDDDAMPAGTSLERALLKGMQDSCAVIFFITPSFRDEGFLQTEIDYAIGEKRAKGDRFAIVTLQFIGGGGEAGAIPELLQQYVWKKPKTHLEGLREIVRALPVVPGIADWRPSIKGVVTSPRSRSATAEMSAEAKSILKTAASGDGRIMHVLHSGGDFIQADNRVLTPDQDARTIARWMGGLEDLQRRRYVKSFGREGHIFEVTREGFDAADSLPDAG